MMFKKLIMITLLLFPLIAAAAWTPITKVKRIHLSDPSGVLYVETVDAIINPAGCETPDMYAINLNSPIKNELYSAIMSASMAGKRVRFNIHDSLCQVRRPVIQNMDLLIE